MNIDSIIAPRRTRGTIINKKILDVLAKCFLKFFHLFFLKNMTKNFNPKKVERIIEEYSKIKVIKNPIENKYPLVENKKGSEILYR